MTDRISAIAIQTTARSKKTEDILGTLRHVYHVAQTGEGYVVVLETPVREDYLEPLLKAISAFDFVEKDDYIDPIVAGPFAGTDFSSKVVDRMTTTLRKMEPKPSDYGKDLDSFAVDIRAYYRMANAIHSFFDKPAPRE